jgi:hypothetical protein
LLGVSACDSRSNNDDQSEAVCPGSRNCPAEG